MLNPEKESAPAVQEAGWASGLVWTCAANIAPTVIRTRTAQLVAGLYSDYVILAAKKHNNNNNNIQNFDTELP